MRSRNSDALNELQKALDAPYELKDDDWEVVFASGGAPMNLLSFQTPETTGGAASNFIIKMFDSMETVGTGPI